MQEPLEETALWSAGANGCHTYRIPSLYTTIGGTILALCEGRRESPKDKSPTDLLIRRSEDGGTTWSDSTIVVPGGDDAVMDPCPVQDRGNGAIWLLFDRYPKGFDWAAGLGGNSGTCWVTSSKDDGLSWDQPRNITKSGKRAEWSGIAHGPGIAIQSSSGRLIVPCNYLMGSERVPGNWGCFITYSDDHGASWSIGGTVSPAVNESQIVELADGRLLWNMRSYRKKGCRAVSYSSDDGISWSEPEDDKNLIEPVCQASFIRSGSDLLFSNPAHQKDRINMTIRMSRDEGMTWPHSRTVYPGGAAYSCLTSSADGAIGLLYEKIHKRPTGTPADDAGWMTLSYVRLSKESITEQETDHERR